MIQYHRHFKKVFKRLDKKVQDRFFTRLDILLEEPYHPLLNHHPLTGEWKPLHSINITGDYRAIFEYHEEILIFRDIGTHSQLYG